MTATNKSFYLQDTDMERMKTIYIWFKEMNVELTPTRLIRYSLFLMNNYIDNVDNLEKEKIQALEFITTKNINTLDNALSKLIADS
jgi:hypothetical protein